MTFNNQILNSDKQIQTYQSMVVTTKKFEINEFGRVLGSLGTRLMKFFCCFFFLFSSLYFSLYFAEFCFRIFWDFFEVKIHEKGPSQSWSTGQQGSKTPRRSGRVRGPQVNLWIDVRILAKSVAWIPS